MNDATPPPGPLRLEPIGIVHAPLASRVEAARQPRAASGIAAEIRLFTGRNFEHALEDLAGWEYIWVLFWFHLNAGWRPKVLPPRSASGRKGVFATRAPHRPNPIGLSAVRLARIEGLTLHILDVDILDGTPVLDIKPYVPYTDAHPGARSGWLDDVAPSGAAAPADPLPAYDVEFEPLAAAQAAWIEEHSGLALRARAVATLSLGPQPHPYRRIRHVDGGMLLAIKEWRVHFRVEGRRVTVRAIQSGFRAAQLAQAGAAGADPVALHRAFVATWPGTLP